MKAKFVKSIIVDDPDGGNIEMVIYKHENGGMFGMDSSFLEQVAEEIVTDEKDCYIIPDPFGNQIESTEPLELYD